MAKDYFIAGESGSSANSGAIESPWRSFGDASVVDILASIQPRDRIFLAETFRPTYDELNTYVLPTLSGRTDVRIYQWEGKPQAVIRADAPLTGVVWTNVSGDVWSTTLVPGLGSPSGMTVAYDDSTWTSNGATHHYGICKPVATTLLVTSTQWSFNYNNGTGATRLHCPGHNPNVSEVTMVREGVGYNLFALTNCVGCRVQGIEARLSGINLSGGGYGFSLNGCTDSTFEGCTAADNSDHGFVILGNTNTNNTLQGCISLGCSWVSTNMVSYVGATSLLTGTRMVNCTAHVLNYLNGSNTELYAVGEITGPTMQGFFCHANTPGSVRSIDFIECMAYVYMPSAGASAGGSNRKGYGVADLAAFAGSGATDKSGRAARYLRCKSRGDTALFVGSQLFQECSFHFTNAGPSMSSPSGFIYCTGGGGTTLDCVAYFEGGEIIANMDRTSGAEAGVVALFGTYAVGEGPSFINTTILNTGVNAADSRIFDYNFKANFVVRAHQCIIGHVNKSAGLCNNDTALPAGVHAFRSNVYLSILDAANSFSLNSSLDTFSEWKSAVDTSAVPVMPTTANAGFADISVDASLSISSSAIRGMTVTNVTPSTSFLNAVADSSIPGPWQYGRRQYLPSSMVQAGSWVDESAGSTNLHLKIDEVLPDTSDYVTNNFTNGTLIVGLPAVTRTRTLNNWVVRTYYQCTDSGIGNFALTVTLREGTTVRATRTITVDPGVSGWIFDVWNIPLASLNGVQDYSTLRLGFSAASLGGENLNIACVQLETDDSVGSHIPPSQPRHLILLSQ